MALKYTSKGRVLIIAGSDSGGGAGIQADIKTVTVHGGYAATAITALTAQNTLGVQDIYPVPAFFVAAQICSVMEDIGADCIKTGMLHRAEVIETVADLLIQRYSAIPLILDPVMVATSGDRLIDEDAVLLLKTRLLPRALLVTPNLPEAEALTGIPTESEEAILRSGNALLEMGAQAVLLKGGHHPRKDRVVDYLIMPSLMQRLEYPRLITRHTHGTGCTLASAIATGIAQGKPLVDTITDARAWLQRTIEAAPGLGAGCGPLWHGV